MKEEQLKKICEDIWKERKAVFSNEFLLLQRQFLIKVRGFS